MSEPVMKPEFDTGRLTPAEYIVALEDEVARLNEAYDLAASQALENGILAARALMKLERVREIGQIIREEAEKLREVVGMSAAKRSHPSGKSREIVEATGRVLRVVDEEG